MTDQNNAISSSDERAALPLKDGYMNIVATVGALRDETDATGDRKLRSRSRAFQVKFSEGDNDEVDVNDLSNVPVTILNTIVDRMAGVTNVESIWRKEVNHAYISRALRNSAARKEVSTFFMNQSVATLIPHLLAVRTLGAGDKLLLTHDIVTAVINKGGMTEPDSINVAGELLNAYLMRVGLVSERNGNYCNLVQYVSAPVTPDTLAADILGQQVQQAMTDMHVVDLDKGKYSPAAFAMEMALSLEKIGIVLMDSHEMNSIVADITRGVRAKIDPNLSGMLGSVPAAWRESDVVREASHNYVFVRAAMSLPLGSNITPVNSEYKLEQFAPAIWTSLRNSDRYRFATVTDLKRTRGLAHVRDVHGVIRSAVLWDSARPDAIAQAVNANADARMKNAIRVTSETSRIAESIRTAYGNVAGMGTDVAAAALINLLRHDVEQDVEEIGDEYSGSSFYSFTVGDNAQVSTHELAALLSRRTFVRLNDQRELLSEADVSTLLNQWVFVCDTKEKQLPAYTGTILAGQLYTTSAVAVLLATESFTPASVLASIPQIIPPLGLGASHIGLDVNDRFRKLNKRASYDIKINGIQLTGAIKASGLRMFASNDDVSIVRPMFNDDVFTTVAHMHSAMMSIVAASTKKNPHFNRAITNLYAQTVISLSEQVSASMRDQIHQSIYAEAGKSLSANEARRLGARLTDDAFRAVINVVSFVIFLRIQGLEAANILTGLVQDANVLDAVAANAPRA